ncbi:MAG: DNA-formamidopyrimidine glycosylase family protein [Caldilineales bacterium]
MPELPDLEVIREQLDDRITGLEIVAAAVLHPFIVRNLLGSEAASELSGRRFTDVDRRGKFLLLALDSGVTVAINPMLAGRIRHGPPLTRDRKRDALRLALSDGSELRYNDTASMGKIYLARDLTEVPTFAEMGPARWTRRWTSTPLRSARRHTGRSRDADQPAVRHRHRQRLRRRDPLARAALPVSPPPQPRPGRTS